MLTWLYYFTAKMFTNENHRAQVKLTSSWQSIATVQLEQLLWHSKATTAAS
jgi:hypothetical protein